MAASKNEEKKSSYCIVMLLPYATFMCSLKIIGKLNSASSTSPFFPYCGTGLTSPPAVVVIVTAQESLAPIS
jgi:hypothetical protein